MSINDPLRPPEGFMEGANVDPLRPKFGLLSNSQFEFLRRLLSINLGSEANEDPDPERTIYGSSGGLSMMPISRRSNQL